MDIIQKQSEEFYEAIISETKRNIDNRFEEIRKLNLQLVNTREISRIISMKPHIDYSRVDTLDLLDISQELTNYKLLNSFIDEIFIHFSNDDIIVSSRGIEHVDNFFNNILIFENNEELSRDSLLTNWKSRAIIPNVEFTYLGRKYDSILQIESISPSTDLDSKATIITVIKKKEIKTILQNLKDKGNFDIYIINENNDIVATNIVMEDIKIIDEYYSYKGQNCTLEVNMDGKQSIFYHITSYANKWDYIAVIPISVIANKVQKFRNIFYFVILLSMIFGMVFIIYLTRKTLSPVKKIINLINKNGIESEKIFRSEFEFIEKTIKSLVSEKDQIQKELKTYSPVFKNNILLGLVKGNMDYGKDEKYLCKYGINFINNFFKVVIFDMEYNANESGNFSKEMLVFICKAIDRIINELKLTGFVFDMELNNIIVIMNLDIFYDDDNESALGRLINKIKEELERNYEIILTIGVGGIYDSMEGIKYSYEEAIQSLSYKMLLGKGIVIRNTDIKKQEDFNYYYPMEKELSLIQNLKIADFKTIEKTLDIIISENIHKRHLDINIAKCMFYDLKATALKALQEVNLSIYSTKTISKDMSTIETFDEMIAYVKKIYYEICSMIRKKKKDACETLIKEILDDIDENISNSNFSMNICSQKHGLSDSKLSRFFKEKMGLYFSDYLNKRRIEKSKALLKESDKTIKEIALEVGYINDITFRRIFKRYELVTPGHYRENND